MKIQKITNMSRNLGIISIVSSFLIPIVGAICSIIGLCIRKNEDKYSRDITLNTIGLSLSVLAWAIYTMMYY